MSEWTPQETLALVAPVFDLSLEEAADCIIIVHSRAGQFYQSVAIDGAQHPGSARERACRLLYIQSLLMTGLNQVGGELHEEVHSE